MYNTKTMMIRRELAKDPHLRNESWNRFLPQFKRQNMKRRRPQNVRDTESRTDTDSRTYMPFPPPQQPSKIDLQLESGEYFLTQQQRGSQKKADKLSTAAERSATRRTEFERQFEAPPEPCTQAKARKSKKRKKKTAESQEEQTKSAIKEDMAEIRNRLKKRRKKHAPSEESAA